MREGERDGGVGGRGVSVYYKFNLTGTYRYTNTERLGQGQADKKDIQRGR